MRKIVVLSFLSLDGVMQAPGGPDEDATSGFRFGGWTVPFFDEFAGRIMDEQMSMPFDLLLGRKTYEIFAGYWPKRDPNVGPTAAFNRATKYVVSSSSPQLGWENSVLVDGDVVAKLEELKAGDGPMLQVHGSGNLIQTLLRHDLVDELWLKIFPVLLASGKRLFAEGTIPEGLDLLTSATSPRGVIFASYKRAGAVETGSFV